MEISVVAIGDELLIGQVVDTNSGEIARIVEPAGWKLANVQVVHDDAAAIRSAIDRAFEQADVVITTGGLGPTKDDITKQVMCDYFGGALVENADVLENVKKIFRKRGLELNRLTATQAMVPDCCTVIQNLVGTAPIMWFEKPDGKMLVAMPGVPFEAIQMFRGEVFPRLLAKYQSEIHIGHRCVILTGITESDAAESLETWEETLPSGYHLAYLPKQGIIRLRIDGQSDNRENLEATLDELHEQLISHFGKKVIATSDLTPEEILLSHVRRHEHTLSTAESCTGGNIAHRITEIAGCSDVYYGSVVSYANEVKTNLLGVNPELVVAHGVVSEPVAREMAEGVCRAIGTTCAVATSGIAGPGGAVPGKPVGTVCIAATIYNRTTERYTTKSHTYHFPGTRDRVIDRASTTAITMLIQLLQEAYE